MKTGAVVAVAVLLLTLSGTRAADERPKRDERSPAAIVRELVDTAAEGGHVPHTTHPVAEVEQWIQRNGESIQAKTASPVRKLPYGACTWRGRNLYVHVFDWPKDGQLVVPVLNKPTKAYLCSDESAVLDTSADKFGRLQIKVPEKAPDPIATVVVLELEGDPEAVSSGKIISPAADGSVTFLAIDAEVIARRAKLERKGQNPHNIGYWTDVRDYVQWGVVLDKPGRYEVALEYSAAPNSGGSRFAIEVLGQSIESEIEATASFLDFKTITLGTVEVPKAGAGLVVVRPLTKPGVAVMDLRKIVLRPL